jgi:methionine biosynthesis protein MetW
MRFDLQIISSWIEPRSKVIDLGCGEGNLMGYLKEKRGVRCTGIEKNEKKVAQCVAKGLNVIHGDINQEVKDYHDDEFDYVILSQTLQQVYEPASLLKEILRIGRMGIVSFPNFSHWRIRLQLMLTGYAPVTKQLPFQWHDTPNIRVITIKDFRKFARDVGFKILKETAIDTNSRDRRGRIVLAMPNLRSTYGIFLIADK